MKCPNCNIELELDLKLKDKLIKIGDQEPEYSQHLSENVRKE